MRWLSVAILLMFAVVQLRAQDDASRRQAIETLLEDISENTDDESDLEQLAEDLDFYLQNPININATNAEELSKLHFLNEFQVASLLDYVRRNGAFVTVYELQMVDGFDQNDVFRLLPFITLAQPDESSAFNIKRVLKYGRNEWLTRASFTVEEPDGYVDVPDSVRASSPEKHYPGNRMKLFSRYSFNFNKQVTAGITAEKDPGEQFFKGHQKKGFDYYSAYIAVHDLGKVETLIVGDFQAKFGQGLVAWSGMSSGKSAYVMDIRKKGAGVKKYSSADENLFYRGVATTLNFGSIKTTFFGSHKKIDATLAEQDTSIAEGLGFSSFGTTGLHATPAQIEKEDAIEESVWGANINFNHNNFKIGASGLGYQFDKDYIKKEQPLYKFDFEGRRNLNVSVDAQYTFGGMYLFGEYAMSSNGGKALVAGSLMNLAPGLMASVLYRNYSRDYQARYANGFAEGSKTQNEEGFFFGIEATPIKKWRVSAYYDIYKFPWIRYGLNAPSRGNDFLAQVDFAPSRNTTMYWKFKTETSQTPGDTEDGGVKPLVDLTRWTLRYHLNYAVGDYWQFKNRIEFSGYKKGDMSTETGCVIYQDVICSPFRVPLSFAFRYAVFETESYNSRVYLYENDVLYAYSMPMVYGKGTKTYLLATWKPFDKLTIWARVSRLWYADKETIGTSPNMIDANHRTDVNLQVRLKF